MCIPVVSIEVETTFMGAAIGVLNTGSGPAEPVELLKAIGGASLAEGEQ